MKLVMNMRKYVSFIKFLDHAHIAYNEVRIVKQPSYLKRYFEQYKAYYKLFLIGHNYAGEYEKLEEDLKNETSKLT